MRVARALLEEFIVIMALLYHSISTPDEIREFSMTAINSGPNMHDLGELVSLPPALAVAYGVVVGAVAPGRNQAPYAVMQGAVPHPETGRTAMNMNSPDSSDVVRAKGLLDELKARGFRFQRTAPGVDGPLIGGRMSDAWMDFVYLEGFSHDCMAWRQRRSLLIVAGAGLIERRVVGGALTVLDEVLTWDSAS